MIHNTLIGLGIIGGAMFLGYILMLLLGIIIIFFKNVFSKTYTSYKNNITEEGIFGLGVLFVLAGICSFAWLIGEAFKN